MASDEPLIDRSLYLIDWEDDADVQCYRDKIGVAATEKIVIAKFLRFVGGEWWCQCRDSLTRLNGVVVGEIVGVIALGALAGCGGSPVGEAHARQPICGNPFDAASAACSQLGVNAASAMVSNYSATTVTTTATPGVTDNVAIISVALTTSGFPTAIDAGATIQASAVTGGILTTCLVSIYRDGAIVPSSQFDVTSVYTAGTNYVQNLLLSATDTPAAGSHTYELHLTLKNGGSSGIATLAAWANFIKVREIKK